MRRKLMWIDGWAVATTLLVLGGFVFTLLLTWTLTAHGQPTPPAKAAVVVKAAPASAPLAHAALLAPAKAAPASQPAVAPVGGIFASQPAAIPLPLPTTGKVGPWLRANGPWCIPLLIFVLSTLATVLSKYPRAKGLVAALRMFLGGLSALEFKDGKRPGVVFKWPVAPPAPPPEPPKE